MDKINLDSEIDAITYNAERLIELLSKSGSIKKADRELLEQAVNIVYNLRAKTLKEYEH